MKEVDVARPLVENLRAAGKHVYQEVQLPWKLAVADIVVQEDGSDDLHIIEVKVSLTWDLMAQAFHRREFARYVSIAIPRRRWKHRTQRYMESLLKRECIGLIYVGKAGSVVHKIPPPENDRLMPNFQTKLVASLHPAQKNFVEAGTANGGHWSPFKQTCREVLAAVKSNPGISATNLVGLISHHYKTEKSAKSNLVAWTRKGVVEGVRVQRKGREVCFYPVDK